MSRPANNPKADTLPDPELNPLLNPLLAANMGRWAEVYFTSPPEKREEAVAGLLRELVGHSAEAMVRPVESSADQNDIKTKTEAGHLLDENLSPAGNSPEENYYAAGATRVCGSCEYINSGGQNFCGMCGTPLQRVSGETNPKAEMVPAALPWDGKEFQAEPFLDASREFAGEPLAELAAQAEHDSRDFVSFIPENAAEARSEARPVAERPQERALQEDRSEASQEHLSQADLPQFAREPEPAPHNRYRLYVGIVLAGLLSLLVYLAWHGTKSTPSVSGSQSPASRVISPGPTAGPEQPQSASPLNSAANATIKKPGANNAAPGGTPAKDTKTTSVAAQPTASRAAPRTPSFKPSPKKRATLPKSTAPLLAKASKASPAAVSQSGAEELATAESCLNGTQGRARDPHEAAQWLWKSMGKGNAAATVALSDLYLRGEGVAKSCDQARLLLNAAARKGSATAAQRLRNLQAFGCQ